MVKYNRIKHTILGDGGLSGKFLMGMKMGFTVGGIFGTLAGLVAYYQTRNFLYIPLSALSMGASFGFFLGVGTVVRSEDAKAPKQYLLTPSLTLIETEPEWKIQLKVNKN